MSSAIDFAAQIVPTRTKSRYAHLLCWRDEFFSNCAILRMAPHPFGKMLMQLAATEAAFRAKKLDVEGLIGLAHRTVPLTKLNRNHERRKHRNSPQDRRNGYIKQPPSRSRAHCLGCFFFGFFFLFVFSLLGCFWFCSV